MQYPKCNIDNPDGVKFCGECGADDWVTRTEKLWLRFDEKSNLIFRNPQF
ncbi:zinc ribbon domain-containing protein [bacterium]|nr:MAG: zinc ribbon domain-containing protein [bacterium]